ncbi:MAG TPA: tetratricopeptide repeat protein [Planctomycetes bacterium]|nr:tetratricopeptide repeat protein [Planctomycetaceae bacterium]HIN95256.1 tetratricopeptide repeat protein [Planctomycetota bacterium]
MRRKSIMSLLSGSLVVGLILVSLSWWPNAFGWQQGTLPAKKPLKRSSTVRQDKATVNPVTKGKQGARLPQPPFPPRVNSAAQIPTASLPGKRSTNAVFDIVASEPISSEPIGGKETNGKPVAEDTVKSPAEQQPTKSKPAADPAAVKPPSKSGKPASPVGGKETSASASQPAIGTAVGPLDQEPAVGGVDSSNQAESTLFRLSRFGLNVELKFPGSEKIQERLQAIITGNSRETRADQSRTGQGGQVVRSARRPTVPESAAVTNPPRLESAPPETGRKLFPFSLPPIAVPRLLSRNGPGGTSPAAETAENNESDSGVGRLDQPEKAQLDSPRPLDFQQLTPGRSSLVDLTEKFGAVQEKSQQDGRETWTFQVGPFQQVKVVVSNQIVRSIRVFFKGSYSTQEMAKQLGIDQFEPVVIRDSRGTATSCVYPERGVTCVYVPGSDPVKIKQLVLDPISPAPFLQRAQVRQHRHYQDALDDLREVQRLDPKNEEAHAMEARLLVQMGQFKRAVQAVDTALQLKPGSHAYKLIRARIQYRSGDWKAAETTIQQVLEDEDSSNLHQAEAICLRGDLYGRHGRREYHVAIQHHLNGIKRVKSLVVSEDQAVSYRAKRILLEAHLGIANDIAWGDWQNKAKVVPKWLNNSEVLLKSLLKDSAEDAALSIHVKEQTLSASMGLVGAMDGKEVVQDLTKNYNELMTDNSDLLFRQRVRWMTGSALYYAGRVAQQQGKSQDALQHATDAHHLLTTVAAGRDFVAQQEILIGDTCFLIGSLQAVYRDDHWEAVNWYQRALKKYEQPTVIKGIKDHGLHGERLVSMGLSFWQNGDHRQGLQLTQQGTDMIEQAVEKQNYQSQVLVVPFGNLVAMYRYLEKEELADQYAQRVAKLKNAAHPDDGQAADEDSPAENSTESSKSTGETPATNEKTTTVSEPDSTEAGSQQEDPASREASTDPDQPSAVKSEPIETAKDPATKEKPVSSVPVSPKRKEEPVQP